MAEGGGLLNRYRVVKPYRGFESLCLRHYYFARGEFASLIACAGAARKLAGGACAAWLRVQGFSRTLRQLAEIIPYFEAEDGPTPTAFRYRRSPSSPNRLAAPFGAMRSAARLVISDSIALLLPYRSEPFTGLHWPEVAGIDDECRHARTIGDTFSSPAQILRRRAGAVSVPIEPERGSLSLF